MATTIKETEAIPAAYPITPPLSDGTPASNPDAIWQRIEAYISHRWTPREVVWIVEGPGEWVPPLTPATVTTVEVWTAGAWQAVSVDPSPLAGFNLPGDGPYRITASVGTGDVPAAVMEAVRRLAEQLAKVDHAPGASSFVFDVGTVKISEERNAAWAARALQNSGAADLLRPYRKAR